MRLGEPVPVRVDAAVPVAQALAVALNGAVRVLETLAEAVAEGLSVCCVVRVAEAPLEGVGAELPVPAELPLAPAEPVAGVPLAPVENVAAPAPASDPVGAQLAVAPPLHV